MSSHKNTLAKAFMLRIPLAMAYPPQQKILDETLLASWWVHGTPTQQTPVPSYHRDSPFFVYNSLVEDLA